MSLEKPSGDMDRRKFLKGALVAGAVASVGMASESAEAGEFKYPGKYEVPTDEIFARYINEEVSVMINGVSEDEIKRRIIKDFRNEIGPLKEILWDSIRGPDNAKVVITGYENGNLTVDIIN